MIKNLKNIINYGRKYIHYPKELTKSVDSKIEKIISNYHKATGYYFNKKLTTTLMKYSLRIIIAASIITIVFLYLNTPIGISIPLMIIGVLTSTITVILIRIMHLITVRQRHFNEKFLYTLSRIVPIVASGATLSETLLRAYELEEDKIIKKELGLIVRDVIDHGMDPLTSIRLSIDRVPSVIYRDSMNLLIEGSKLTPEVSELLVAKLESLIRSKSTRLRSLTTSLTLLFQTYVLLAFLLPVLVVIISIALSPLGLLNIGGFVLNPEAVTLFLALIYSPIIAYIFYIIFDVATSTV